ncbi:MAG: NAD(P)H-hydrate dehydratase [Methanoregulaceae archaeon]
MTGEDLSEFRESGTITPERMRAVDRNAVALGVSGLQMMESAGKALAESALSFSPSRVLILCGKGNNGGDGMAAARYLQSGVETDLIYLAEEGMSRECAHQLAALRYARVRLHPLRCAPDLIPLERLFSEADVIIDAMLGTGFCGTVREPLATCVAYANESPAKVIAADVPTPGTRADRILAFHRQKHPGSVIVDIGIPYEAEIFTGPGDLTLIPPRPITAHKGAGGKVLIIGGGPYQGAPYLAGLAALRSGADLVRIASPVYVPVPDLIFEPLPGERVGEEHRDRLRTLARDADVVLCGNGLGTESHQVVTELAPEFRKVVFDADALRLPLPSSPQAIYTPHTGEFMRMTGITLPADPAERGRAVKVCAATCGTVLLKGSTDVISDGTRVRFNRTGTPAMTVGGTGDVLAGITAALFCHLPAFEAACIAAYVNGKAGMAVEARCGGGLIASDLISQIPIELFRSGTKDA